VKRKEGEQYTRWFVKIVIQEQGLRIVLLHPTDALFAPVQPDQLIVADPCRPELVGAADKADPRSVCMFTEGLWEG